MRINEARIEMDTLFQSGKTLDVKFRIQNLKKLRALIKLNEKRILRSLFLDLKKPSFEAYSTEIGQCLSSIEYTLKNLKKWTKPERVSMPLFMLPGQASIHPQPLGKVLIFAPWNYPFQLSLLPLIGALAAGNVVILKPSELSGSTSRLIKELIENNFPTGLIRVVEGGPEVAEELLQFPWDHIFFTGSPQVGRSVMRKAAEHLTPVTLELGGKSPAWIDQTAHLEISLKRVLWAKFVNAGQTCIAPDYLIIHQKHLSQLTNLTQKILSQFFGENPQESTDYARIINQKHFQRLTQYLQYGHILVGGQTDSDSRYIAPTLLTDVALNSALMKEEIFGPLLPVFSYENESEVYDILKLNPHPLALYLFSENKELQEKVISQLQFGGGVINDALIHWGIEGLPAGGVGTSGMGAYHGKRSFQTFSHYKSIVRRWAWPDPSFRYPPYEGKFSLLKKLLK